MVGVGRGKLDQSATTQVSYAPQLGLELTTRAPSGSATRVRPPGRTHTDSPLCTANGRKSTCRGTSSPSSQVGTVDRPTTGWAIQARGSADTSAHSRSSSAALAPDPKTRPQPPAPSN